MEPKSSRTHLDPDQTARFDQELADLRDRWTVHVPDETRPSLDNALRSDPYLTHQIFTLVDETLLPHQGIRFLRAAASHLTYTTTRPPRPILAGLKGLRGNTSAGENR